MNEENIPIRLKGFIENSGLSYSQFADTCGIPRPSLTQILNGRNKKISDVIIAQIHSAFPKLSVMWLLFGEGEMLVKATSDGEIGASGHTNPDENPENAGNCAETNENPILEAVKSNVNGTQIHVNNQFRPDARVCVATGQIEENRPSQRKVIQITVYYDDSTFETFYPPKEKK